MNEHADRVRFGSEDAYAVLEAVAAVCTADAARAAAVSKLGATLQARRTVMWARAQDDLTAVAVWPPAMADTIGPPDTGPSHRSLPAEHPSAFEPSGERKRRLARRHRAVPDAVTALRLGSAARRKPFDVHDTSHDGHAAAAAVARCVAAQLRTVPPGSTAQTHGPHAQTAELYLEPGACVLTVPLLVSGRFVGMIEADWPSTRHADQDTLDALGALGVPLARTLHDRVLIERERRRNLLLAAQLECLPDATVVVSPANRIVAANQRFLDVFCLEDEHGRRDNVPSDAALDAARSALTQDPAALEFFAHARAVPNQQVQRTIRLPDGRTFDLIGVPVVDHDGTYHGRAWHGRDVTARDQQDRALRELTTTLQQALLPAHLPQVPGLDVASRYRAGGAGIEVGGDFYDMVPTGAGRWSAILGDVCGSGPAAATVTALTRHTARAIAPGASAPSQVLRAINSALLLQQGDQPFCTAVQLDLTIGQHAVDVTVACGGHPPPLARRADGTVHPVGVPGTLLGVLDEVDLSDVCARLDVGDALVLVTDGVLEARDAAGEEYGEDRLTSLLAGTSGLSASQIADRVEQDVRAHQGWTPHRDDYAVLVLAVPEASADPGPVTS